MANKVSPAIPLLRQSITQVARAVEWQLNKAFEETGCSCHPLREELDRVRAQCEELLAEAVKHPAFERREQLQAEIAATDRREHPGLDKMASVAGPFFRVWLFQQIKEGHPPGLDNSESLAKAYALAWMGGWRPDQAVTDE